LRRRGVPAGGGRRRAALRRGPPAAGRPAAGGDRRELGERGPGAPGGRAGGGGAGVRRGDLEQFVGDLRGPVERFATEAGVRLVLLINASGQVLAQRGFA